MEEEPKKISRRDMVFFLAGIASAEAINILAWKFGIKRPAQSTNTAKDTAPRVVPTETPSATASVAPDPNSSSLVLSIDAMKMSRDTLSLSREQIQMLCQEARNTGATHIAIGTPYDDFAYKYLKDWVSIAKSQDIGLNVWLRGNFSDWENWHENKIHNPVATPEDHHRQFSQFLAKLHHDGLISPGDIVSPCPEPENGKIIGSYWDNKQKLQNFIRDSYINARNTLDSFGLSGVRVVFSYNADVAADLPTEIYDLLKIIGLDHYPAADATEMATRIAHFHHLFPGKEIWIAETGSGMKDRQKITTQEQQAAYMELLFQSMASMKVSAINIWTIMGGDTALVDPAGGNAVKERPVYQVVSENFRRLRAS